MLQYPHRDIVAFFNPIILSLKLCVYWGPDENSSRLYKILYRVYSFSMFMTMFVVYETGLVYKLSLYVGDFEQIVSASLLFVTNVGQMVKFYVTFAKNKRIQAMVKSVNGKHFQPKNKRQEEMITQGVLSGYRMTRAFLILGLSTWALWAVYPLVEKGKSPSGIQLPFDTSESPYFEIQYSYETLSVFVHVIANVNKDSIPVMLMSLIGGELDALNDMLINLRTSAVESLINATDQTNEAVSKRMETLMIECIDRHRALLRLADELNNTYTYAILAQFCVSVIILCLTMFRTTELNLFTIETMSMAIYIVCMSLQLLCYCWAGNEVIVKSTRLYNSIYCMDWVETSIKFKKHLLFFMMRLQKPIKAYSGNFFSISVATYTSILRTSYSYFAVLNSSKEDK